MKGIYIIKIEGVDNVYIGMSADIASRFNTHMKLLRNNTHFNSKLQQLYDARGRNAFSYDVLERFESISRQKLEELEKRYIEDYRIREVPLLNIAAGGYGGDTSTGRSAAERLETSAKLSAARRGDRNGRFGKEVSQETRDKISKANKGKKRSEEHIKLIKANVSSKFLNSSRMKGKTLSPESVQKMIRNNPRSRKVEYGGSVYNSLGECARQIGRTRAYVKRRCKFLEK